MRSWLLLALAGCVADTTTSPAPASDAPTSWRAVAELPGAQILWDRDLARPKLVIANAPVTGAPEAAARSFLGAHAQLFAVAPDTSDLALATTRQGKGGTYLRFDEQAGGLPVFDGQVIVLVGGGAVKEINLANHGHVDAPALAPDLGADAALDAARTAVGRPAELAPPSTKRGVVAGPPSRLAYQVIVNAGATWDVGVDAATGAILWKRDDNRYVDGEGLVFDVNPVSSTGDTSLTDTSNVDADRFSVTLTRLDGSGFLRGSYVDAQTKNINSRAVSASETFDFGRSIQFDEVMAYYHLDRVQDRIQTALGFTNVNNRVQVTVVDALTQDNSFYNPSSTAIEYGTGGVDDAEDAEVIVHEYGHSCQDNQVPGYGGGDEGAMGEGFGDYLAGSMEAVLAPANGHNQVADPNCLADWDATSYSTDTPPCLRRLDGTKHEPEDLDGEVHDDGEMWSAALWAARAEVGPDVMDQDVIEAHFLLSTSESFDSASNAILATDTTVFGGAHLQALRTALYHQGVLRTVMTPSPLTNVFSSDTVSIAESNYPANYDHTQSYTHAGAMALRVHFATLDTENGSGTSCLDGGCDNVYLYDGAGNLYQILHGPTQSDVTSVAIPGDTVQVRLVSDAQTQRSGFTIDRVDVMGDGVSIDAAPADAAGGGDGGGGNPGGPDAGDGKTGGMSGGCCSTSGGGAAGSVLLALLALAGLQRRRA